MKIAVDGGALCSPSYKRFGTFTFTSSLLTALSKYDTINSYYPYSFCNKPPSVVLGNNMFYKILKPKFLWTKVRISLEEFTAKSDIYLALNQAIPLYTSGKVIAFSHGLSFLHYPKLYPYGAIQLKNQLQSMVKRADVIVVSSQKVKIDLESRFINRNLKIAVLPFGIPMDFEYAPEKKRQPYFMFVGSNHPIKQVQFLIDAFADFIQKEEYSHYELHLVGPFNLLKKKAKNVSVFTKLPRSKLQGMYQRASGYLTASLYESYNLPALEALSQGCPVIGLETAVIPEFKEYCEVVDSKDAFIKAMKKIADGKGKEIDNKKLKEKFSWKTYVQELMRYY